MYEKSMRAPFGRRPTREEGLISVITNGNILYLVTFKWLLAGAYGLPHTCNALTQYSSYFNCLVYNVFLLFFSSQNFRRGGALAPCIDAPPLVLTVHKVCMFWNLKSSDSEEDLLSAASITIKLHIHTRTHTNTRTHTHPHTHSDSEGEGNR